MTNSSDEGNAGGHGIEDKELPADVRPSEENPLAEGLDDTETAGDLDPGELLEEGKHADQDQGDPERSDMDDSEG